MVFFGHPLHACKGGWSASAPQPGPHWRRCTGWCPGQTNEAVQRGSNQAVQLNITSFSIQIRIIFQMQIISLSCCRFVAGPLLRIATNLAKNRDKLVQFNNFPAQASQKTDKIWKKQGQILQISFTKKSAFMMKIKNRDLLGTVSLNVQNQGLCPKNRDEQRP